MSRETDSSSSGPKRRRRGAGSSYPSGTEPYGTPSGEGASPVDPGAGPGLRGRPEPEQKTDEPRTETTLTTRIRINIPGSRPIPPVVMRTPVSEEEAEGDAAQGSGEEHGPGAASPLGNGAGPGAAAGPGAGADSGSGSGFGSGSLAGNAGSVGGNSAAGTPGSAASTGSVTSTSPLPTVPSTPGAAAPAPSGAAPAAAFASASGAGRGEGSGSGDTSGTGEFTQQTSDWFSPRKSRSAPTPPPASSPPPPSGGAGQGGGTSGDRSDLPYFSGPSARGEDDERDAAGESTDGAGARPPFPSVSGPSVGGQREPADGQLPLLDPALGRGAGASAPAQPDGPTTGPATGDMPLPHAPRGESASAPPSVPGPPAAPDGPNAPGATGGSGTQAGPGGPGAPGGPEAPGGSGAPGAPGADGEPAAHSTLGLGTGPAPFAPDGVGTALYGTGAPGEGAGADGALRAGKPVVSGVPHGAGEDGPGAASPGSASPAPPAAPAPQRKGGRNKLALAGVAVVGVLGIAYGTGLLLDHADVPKGTTVLGVEIGGLTKHEAVNKLDDGLGGRTTEPFTVVAAGQKAELKPSVAGLTFDTEATVREAAGRDYNPVSVIGSLFGMDRDADPAVKVDEAKMESALARVTAETSGAGGNASDGMVRFVGGKPVAVKGKPHKGIDMKKSPGALEKAYKERAVSGRNKPVTLPVGLQQPSVTQKQLKAAVAGPGRTAMSGWVWLQAGDVKVPFSQKTMGEFLTMRPGGGKLVFVIDPKALKATYGTAFDNVVVQGGAGTVKMTPQHAAVAMTQALQKKAPPEPGQRVAKVPGAVSQ